MFNTLPSQKTHNTQYLIHFTKYTIYFAFVCDVFRCCLIFYGDDCVDVTDNHGIIITHVQVINQGGTARIPRPCGNHLGAESNLI